MLDLFPLSPRSKMPRADENWREKQYTADELKAWKGNFGVRLAPGQAVLDVDPRQDPQQRTADEILAAFELEHGLDLGAARRVRSGGDGLHVYVSLPDGVKLREKVGTAIELKQHGKYVLAPGSVHPDTGRTYELLHDGPLVPLPATLCERFSYGPRESAAVGETISAEHLRRLLSQIDVMQFHDAGRGEWLKVMLEAHAATGGSAEGFEVFAEWSASDEAWSDDVENWEYQWERAHGERPGDRTLASLIHRVVEAGGNPHPPVEEDFDELPDPPDPLAGRAPQPLAPYDPYLIPMRPWLVGGMLLDGTVTLLVAKGGAGKSLFVLHLAAMVANGTSWAHWSSSKSGRVLLLNAEDDRNELLRRLTVVSKYMNVDPSSLAGRIDAYARGELPDFVLLKRMGDRGEAKRTELFAHLKELIVSGNYGLVVIDPLIKVHSGLDENSNDDMELVARMLGELAENPAVSVLAVHHASKGGAGRGQDASRGGGSIVAAARNLLNIEPMDDREAESLLPVEQRHRHRSYVKVVGDKQNYNESAGAQWLKLESDYVHNGEDGGDRAAALVPWNPHAPADVTPEQINEILDEVMRRSRLGGERYYRPDLRGPRDGRADTMIADMLGVTETQGRGLLKRLMEQGKLVEQTYEAKGRASRRLVVSDEAGADVAETHDEVEEEEA